MRVAEVVRKRKVPIAVVLIAIVGVLFILLALVPLVFGEQFVSFSSELVYIAGPTKPMMEIVYVNGSVVPISWISLTINVTNSYFVPVEVKYNGFEFVWLIYNQTVTDPTDVVGNKDFLVWGAFQADYLLPRSPRHGFYSDDWLRNMTGYEYYMAHKDLSNYTKTIPVGTRRYYKIFGAWSTEPLSAWAGQDIRRPFPHNPVSPGTYYIYPIVYGKVGEPINLTVVSITWPV